MSVVGEAAAAGWAEEFARTGEVRIPPRRSVTALRMLLFGLPLANQVATIVSAALGRQNWLWLPLLYALAVPVFVPLVWINARATLFGRPVLVVDGAGVSLGRNRLAWQEIQAFERPRFRRRRPYDPRRPVDGSLEWFASFTIVPITNRRKRQISVGNDHVKELGSLATWLETLRQAQSASGGSR
jgi:hypothetical protein